DQYLLLFELGVFILSHLTLQICRKDASIMCSYVNGMINLGKIFSGRKLLTRHGRTHESLIVRVNILIAYGIVCTIIFFLVAFLYGFYWNKPCTPAIAGY